MKGYLLVNDVGAAFLQISVCTNLLLSCTPEVDLSKLLELQMTMGSGKNMTMVLLEVFHHCPQSYAPCSCWIHVDSGFMITVATLP